MHKITDVLAIERTKLANQRTLMAYLRTSFYFLGLGLTIVGIESFEKLKCIAVPLFVLSPFIIFIGLWSFFKEQQKIEKVGQRIK